MPRLPRETKVDVRLCHACHVKRRWMSPSATPATQSAAASRATKPGPRVPPNAMSATPATQDDRGCEIVPRLPRETKVDVSERRIFPGRNVPILKKKQYSIIESYIIFNNIQSLLIILCDVDSVEATSLNTKWRLMTGKQWGSTYMFPV